MHTTKVAVTVLLVLLLCGFAFPVLVSAQDARISAAETALNQAFTATFEAEKTGQDITSLLEQLDTASILLADAQNAYLSGNTGSTASYTEQVIQISNTVKAQAATLKEEGIEKTQTILIETAVGSVGGIVVCLAVFFFGWKFFKKIYLKRMMTWTPEVNAPETQ
ncbi:MAG: hypothetical protein NWF01_04040 [Candidatus Bathyarchaeota archaeon]|nr:hypothetical protein [Candidatus Bathyarchaeota archaeon]